MVDPSSLPLGATPPPEDGCAFEVWASPFVPMLSMGEQYGELLREGRT